MTQCCDDKTSIILSFVIGFYLVGGFTNKLLKEPLKPSNIIIDTLKFLAWSTFLLVALGYFSAQTFLTIFKVITTSIITFVKYLLYVGYIGPNGIQQPQPAGNRLGGVPRARRENQEPQNTNQEPQNTNNDMDELRRKPKKPKGDRKFNFNDDENGPLITENQDKRGVYDLVSGSTSQIVGGRENIEVITEEEAAIFENNNNNNNNVQVTTERPITFSLPYDQSYGAALDRGEEATFEFTLETREVQGQFGTNIEPIRFPFPNITEYSIDNDEILDDIEQLFLGVWNRAFNKYINNGRFHEGIIYFENSEEDILNFILDKLLSTYEDIKDKIDIFEQYIRACILQGRNVYEASINIIEQYTENIEKNVNNFEEELLIRETEYGDELLNMANIYVILLPQNISPQDVSYDMIEDFLNRYENIESNASAMLLNEKFDEIQRLLKFHDLYEKLIKPTKNKTGINILNQTVKLIKQWLDLGKRMRKSSKKKKKKSFKSEFNKEMNQILEELKKLESSEAVNIFIEIMKNPTKRKDINIFFNFILKK
jgi:hypothetical protein